VHRWVEVALAGDLTSDLGMGEVPYAVPAVSAARPVRDVRPAREVRPVRPVRALPPQRVPVDVSGTDRAIAATVTRPHPRPAGRARHVRKDAGLSEVVDGALLLSTVVFMLLLIAGGVWLTAMAL